MPLIITENAPVLNITNGDNVLTIAQNGSITFPSEDVGGTTNLTYTASPTQGTVVSSSGTDAIIPAADVTNAGLFLPAEKTKLDGIATGAEVNVNADWNAVSGDAQILNKPTIPTVITDHTALSNIGTNSHAQIDSHLASTANPHSVTKTQIGLSNVDNTSDANKPISTATQTALNNKQDSSTALTLGETIITAYRGDRGKTAYDHSQVTTGNPHSVTKSDIGLGNVPNLDTSTTANIVDSSNKRFITDAQQTVLSNTSGTNTGDQTLNGLLPNQTGNTGKVLQTDGANATWQTPSSGGVSIQQSAIISHFL